MFERPEPHEQHFTLRMLDRHDRRSAGEGPLATILLSLGGILILASSIFVLTHFEDRAARFMLVPGFSIGLILMIVSRLGGAPVSERRLRRTFSSGWRNRGRH
jgi:hypothetical protein